MKFLKGLLVDFENFVIGHVVVCKIFEIEIVKMSVKFEKAFFSN